MALSLFEGAMELAELRVFMAVAAERSFSLAAVKLGRTQPAISQAIRRLEDQLGERLFDRTKKQASLTPAGDALLREGTRVLRVVDETTAAVRRESARERAILKIGGDEPGAHALLPALWEFLIRHATVNIEFRRMTEAEVVTEVGAGRLDIGIVTTHPIPQEFQQIRIATSDEGFAALLPRGHVLAGRREISPHVLHDERMIVLSDVQLPKRALPASENSSVPTGSFFVSMPGLDSLRQAVATGIGIGIVPRAVVSSVSCDPRLVAIPLVGVLSSSTLTLLYRESAARAKGTAGFISTIRNMRHAAASTKPVAVKVSR
jgi:DNA-binding transcriptional LysR family regulator